MSAWRVRWREEAKAELIALAHSGKPWAAIGAVFWPGANARRAANTAAMAFARFATPEDREARREALKARRFNSAPVHGYGGGGRRVEPPLRRERVDIFAGLGECSAEGARAR